MALASNITASKRHIQAVAHGVKPPIVEDIMATVPSAHVDRTGIGTGLNLGTGRKLEIEPVDPQRLPSFDR